VRRHHAKGLLDPQVKRAPHMLGNVPDQGVEVTRHGAPGLRFARLKSGGPQHFQLLLGGVVGYLDRLRLGRRRPESRPQA
jgi:hypothetical protein